MARGPVGVEVTEVTLLPTPSGVAREHLRAGAQPDNLCGPYWVATLARAANPAIRASAEEAALVAGTTVPSGDPGPSIPRGERPRNRYALPIPVARDPAASGTSVPGMLAAAEEVTGGAFGFVPVRGARGGGFDAGTVERLLGVLLAHAGWAAVPVLNVRTGRLWGSRVSLAEAAAYLAGEDVDAPDPDWDVGHFLTVAGVVRGPARTMLLLRDSYPSFGWGGYHLQPLDAVAAALARGDGREGGCLLFVASGDGPEVERELKEQGFDIGIWDNGTPYDQGG